MKNKSPSFAFFPEKFIAGTRHLSETNRAIYMDMMCNIWTLTPSQVDFPDTTAMWMILTGLSDVERVIKVREDLMIPGLEMFMRKRIKNEIFLVQKGMRKEKRKQRRHSLQNSENARSGWEKRRCKDASALMPQSDGTKSAMPSLSVSFSSSNKKTRNAFNPRDAKTEKDQIGKTLAVYLERYQIENVFRYMPDVPAEYVNEKIKLAVKKRPENMAAFLYTAIMQNYHPGGTGEEDISEWLKKAVKRDLSITEFKGVPEEERSRFEKIIMPGVEKKEFKLISKPKKVKNYIEKRLFKSMKTGECVDENAFSKVRTELQEHFEAVKKTEKERVVYRLLGK